MMQARDQRDERPGRGERFGERFGRDRDRGGDRDRPRRFRTDEGGGAGKDAGPGNGGNA